MVVHAFVERCRGHLPSPPLWQVAVRVRRVRKRTGDGGVSSVPGTIRRGGGDGVMVESKHEASEMETVGTDGCVGDGEGAAGPRALSTCGEEATTRTWSCVVAWFGSFHRGRTLASSSTRRPEEMTTKTACVCDISWFLPTHRFSALYRKSRVP